MPIKTVEFVLSDQTKTNLQAALEQMKDFIKAGYSVDAIRIEERDQNSQKIQVGVIEVVK